MGMKRAAMATGLAFGLISGSAEASYIINVRQVGADVVATGSGKLNLSGLSGPYTAGFIPATQPAGAFLTVGTENLVDQYLGVSGPSSFGSNLYTKENTSVGVPFIIYGGNSSIYVLSGYQSNTNMGVSTGTWTSKTFAELGLEAGNYKFSWSSDSVTVNISMMPLPSSALMLGAALLGLAGLGVATKRKRSLAVA